MAFMTLLLRTTVVITGLVPVIPPEGAPTVGMAGTSPAMTRPSKARPEGAPTVGMAGDEPGHDTSFQGTRQVPWPVLIAWMRSQSALR